MKAAADDNSYITQFTFLGHVLSRWQPSDLVVEEFEREDRKKVITYWKENTVIAQCLTREDNRIIRMLWPNFRPH